MPEIQLSAKACAAILGNSIYVGSVFCEVSLHYNSIVWNPNYINLVDLIENVQRNLLSIYIGCTFNINATAVFYSDLF